MTGHIVYVERKPSWFKDISHRLNEDSAWLDRLIARFVLYRHYGIMVENSEIIQFYCPSILKLNQGSIRQVPLSDFLKAGGIIEIDQAVNLAFTRDEVVRRAKMFVGSDFGGYHMTKNNCEHFAVWCGTDQRKMSQKASVTTYRNIYSASGTLKRKIISTLV
ncbi:MAG: lecithin retinol acyltransferase family protein [Eubacteriales bacterium]|nr:lecithin retinol acyltransferase family protein [Eubacteriales bacterium]